MAPRVPNTKVPNARVLLRDGVGRSKYVPRTENSEFSITRITPQNALNLVRKFSDKELETQYSKGEIGILHDEASKALREEIISITGRDSNGNVNFNEKSTEWLLQNDPLINRLIKSGSKDAQSLRVFLDVKLEDLEKSNPKLLDSYNANSWIKANDGIWVNNPETHEWTRYPNVLTDPPKDLPKTEVDKANMLSEDNTPAFLTRKGETPSTIPAAENPAAASPSPEVIGEAMRDAVSKDGTVTVPPEAVAEEVAKEKANPKAVTDGTEVKTAEATTGKAEAETPPEKGALTGEGEKTSSEPSKGVFGRTWDFLRNHRGKILGWGLGAPIGLGIAGTAIYDLASDNSTLKSLFRGNYPTSIPNTPSATQPRNEPVTNEEYTPGKIPNHIPQDNLTSIKESTASKKVKNRPQQQKQQPQVVNAPENNATADYVRAAYNSYIPSDAGRAYQKAIYGDPLELERNRQQQKWRDFVMRSGQSPAELVQRGLMPYDALQYV